jgi:hypothetical protein
MYTEMVMMYVCLYTLDGLVCMYNAAIHNAGQPHKTQLLIKGLIS